MSPRTMFEVWAPEGVPWSTWAKPVVFAQYRATPDSSWAGGEWRGSWAAKIAALPRAAIVVNLPGEQSLEMGIMLAGQGYRPVPLFNCCAGEPRPAVEMRGIMGRLPRLTEELRGLEIPWDAPPAFLIDSHRCPRLAPTPGSFDNRWVVFPQDFPSGRFLREQGVGTVLILELASGQVQEDLAHVLRRWQEAGITLQHLSLAGDGGLQPLRIGRPAWFRSLMYRALVLMGLRRSSGGGFGSLVPEARSGGG